jgi:hypothetical protein
VIVCGLPGVYEKICGGRDSKALGVDSYLYKLGYHQDMVVKLWDILCCNSMVCLDINLYHKVGISRVGLQVFGIVCGDSNNYTKLVNYNTISLILWVTISCR